MYFARISYLFCVEKGDGEKKNMWNYKQETLLSVVFSKKTHTKKHTRRGEITLIFFNRKTEEKDFSKDKK